MNMHVIYLFACLATMQTINAQSKKTEKEYSSWWESCLGQLVSFEIFSDWIGPTDAPSRVQARHHIAKKGYHSFLDIPCGLCIDYFGLKRDKTEVYYHGVDITPKLIALAKKQHIPVTLGSIEDIPFEACSFDVVYARHILEHLQGYHKAIDELIRVARKEVLIVFFIPPTAQDQDEFHCSLQYTKPLCHNTYARKNFEHYALQHHRVTSLEWETVPETKEVICHIMVSET